MSPRQVELVIRRDGHPERRVALAPGAVVIGRADDNDVVLSDIGVSRRHARIIVEGDAVHVEDMGSGNGTWFRGERVERQLVDDGDEVVIDPFVLGFSVNGGDATGEVTAGADATVVLGGLAEGSAKLTIVLPHAGSQQVYELAPGGSRTLGRSEKADIVLPEPVASRLHCDLGETAGIWWLRDRDSANGTFVNGARVREKVLADGDRIRIGSVEMRFSTPSAPELELEEPGEHTEAFDAVMFTAAVIDPAASAPNLASAPTTPPAAGGTTGGPDGGTSGGGRLPLAAAPTILREPEARTIPPPPTLPKAGPPPGRPGAIPAPPKLPFTSSPAPLPRPAPATLPPPAPAGPAASPPAAAPTAPGVEIDFDVDKVKARKGPKGRAVRRGGGGFLSRPINQISLGILLLAGLMVGGRMVFDMSRAMLAASARSAEAEVEPASAAPTTLVASPAAAPLGASPAATLEAAPPAAAAAQPTTSVAAPAALAAAAPAASAAPSATEASSAASGAAPRPPAPLAAPAAVAPSARAPLEPTRREEVAALMAEGMRLFAEGKPFDAAAQFHKVQKLDPGNPDAERMGYVACEYIAMQRMFEELQARSASETERATAKQGALTAVAAALADASQLGAAAQALQAALSLLPGDPELAEAQTQLESRRSAVARGAAVRKEQAKQASLAEMVAAGQRELDRGNLTKAVRQWEGVLQADPSRASPQYYQAEEGIRAAKDRMKVESKKAYASGLSAYKDGDLLTARSQLAQTVRIDPYNDAAGAKLAEVRKRLRDQASEIYKEARVLEDINQVEKALALYQKVLTYVDDPSDSLSGKAQSRINALLR